ncbi:hypothetical protein Hanom_Chr03g00214771 [Helianthus anomalus]
MNQVDLIHKRFQISIDSGIISIDSGEKHNPNSKSTLFSHILLLSYEFKNHKAKIRVGDLCLYRDKALKRVSPSCLRFSSCL